MVKKLEQTEEETESPSRQKILSDTKKMLKHLYPCYVLIACSEPKEDGQMDVEMSFEGDEDLAALITENATQIFEQRVAREKIK